MCAAGRAFGDRKAPSSQGVLEGGRVGRVRGSRISCSSLAEGQQRAASAPCAPSAGGAPALLGSKSPWEVSRHLVPSLPHQLHISMKAMLVSWGLTLRFGAHPLVGHVERISGDPSKCWGPVSPLVCKESSCVSGGEWRDHL